MAAFLNSAQFYEKQDIDCNTQIVLIEMIHYCDECKYINGVLEDTLRQNIRIIIQIIAAHAVSLIVMTSMSQENT